MMIHDLVSNQKADYHVYLTQIKDVISTIGYIDFEIFDLIDEDASVYVNEHFSASKNEKFNYLCCQLDNEYILRIKFNKGTIVSVQVSRGTWKNPLIQIFITDKNYLINELWFDKMNFEAVAFQIDSITEYPFLLMDVYEIIKLMEKFSCSQ